MTNPVSRVTDERLAEIVKKYGGDFAAVAAELQSLRALSPSESEGEVVAWRRPEPSMPPFHQYIDARPAEEGWEPLYTRPQPRQVEVKELEWGKRKANGDIYADSVVGEYGVGEVHGQHHVMLRVGETDTRIAKAGGFEAAKAAAQADYERRILSALNYDPEAAQSALSEALEVVRPFAEVGGLALLGGSKLYLESENGRTPASRSWFRAARAFLSKYGREGK